MYFKVWKLAANIAVQTSWTSEVSDSNKRLHLLYLLGFYVGYIGISDVPVWSK